MPTKNLWLFPAMLTIGFLLLALSILPPGPVLGLGASGLSIFAFMIGIPMFVTGLIFSMWLLFKRP